MELNILHHWPKDGDDGESYMAIHPKKGETVEDLVGRTLKKWSSGAHRYLVIRIAAEE